MKRLAERIAKLERSRGNGYVASRFLRGHREMTVAVLWQAKGEVRFGSLADLRPVF